MNKKVLLIILDGFGHSNDPRHNAIRLARTPNYNMFLEVYPHSLLITHGREVGLPDGIMGNSEVGHLNIGSGRIIYQDLSKISKFSKEIGFDSLPDLQRIIKNPTGAFHIIGLLSDGGVHSHIEHLFSLIDSAQKISKEKPVFIHIITDGRDTSPKSGIRFAKELQKKVDNLPNVAIASVCGRFYVMDRDKRWERVQEAYNAYAGVVSPQEFVSAEKAIEDAYSKNETDEFIKPRWVEGGVHFTSKDQVLFFNYRADRAREISQAFALSTFKEFKTPVKIKPENWVTFTVYQKDFPFPALFPQETHKNILGEIISKRGDKQLRVAETEKYAHVTYFFNGGVEVPFEGEDRVLVPSPKDVKTYDEKPEMSAREVAENILKSMDLSKYKLIVSNFANGDMVGHTGVESAAVRAVEVLDELLGKIVNKALEKGFNTFITADHGNVEEMYDFETNQPSTQHSLNPVPFIWIAKDAIGKKLKNGVLADIAPTILTVMGIAVPQEMTGKSLISG